MKRLLCTALCLIVGVGLAPAVVAQQGPPNQCDHLSDTGEKIKCKAQRLDDAVGRTVATASSDPFLSDAQRRALGAQKDRARNELVDRTESFDFKGLGKRNKTQCQDEEILGDIDPADDTNLNGLCDDGEDCLGNEDGLCNGNEMAKGGCAEARDDGIGDDDGICEMRGKYKEKCVQVCDPEVTLASEENVDTGRADDLMDNLDRATEVVDEFNEALTREVARRMAAANLMQRVAQSPTLAECSDLLQTQFGLERPDYELLQSKNYASVVLQGMYDSCASICGQDYFGYNCMAACVVFAIPKAIVEEVAVTMELKDDTMTATRLDAVAGCLEVLAPMVSDIQAKLDEIILMLQTPQGRRPRFPHKP